MRGAIRRFFRWRWEALLLGIRDATAYRAEFFVEILGSALIPAGIQLILWHSIFRLGGATTLGGLRYEDFIQYTLVSVLFSQVRGGNHDFDLQEMIRTGSLSNFLLRPVGPVQLLYLQGISAKLLIATLCLAIGLVAGTSLGLTPGRLLGAMAMALLGNVIHYQIGAALAASSFFWEEAWTVLMVKNMVVQLLCGELLPLHLFPTSLSWLWRFTPFYLYVYGPTQFATGKWSVEEFGFHFGLGLAWLLASGALVYACWAIGKRRYLSLGG